MNNDQSFQKRNQTTAYELLQAIAKDRRYFLIKLGVAIATVLEAIALRFLNPAGFCYSMTFYTVQLL
ncbi:hypothetical protein [Nostoc sp.]|uniref:hypothetical protein n=1 Tax=Nostoc sp. TaxID=1180 RepID=UPI002FFCC503